ncbi:MAG: hypothetical protein AB1817_22570 [Chloroflexota bacterium]
MRNRILVVAVGLCAFCIFLALALTTAPPLRDARDLDALTIYAYRDWQSTGFSVKPEQRVSIRARGQWLYTPGEWHGPEGHARYRAPSFYPLPNLPGGALIGKIGESGKPFLVGNARTLRASSEGMLYLRINDDILSDNEGQVEVELQTMPSTD